MNFKDDLQINKFALDLEWEKQPVLFIEWAEKSVEASFVKDKTKEKLELIMAELDMEMRKDPNSFGIEKITETVVLNTIKRHLKYQEIYNLYLESIKSFKLFEIVKEAFDHKKKALEKLTDLFISGYWAIPNISSGSKEVFTKDNTAVVNSVLKKNKRLIERANVNKE